MRLDRDTRITLNLASHCGLIKTDNLGLVAFQTGDRWYDFELMTLKELKADQQREQRNENIQEILNDSLERFKDCPDDELIVFNFGTQTAEIATPELIKQLFDCMDTPVELFEMCDAQTMDDLKDNFLAVLNFLGSDAEYNYIPELEFFSELVNRADELIGDIKDDKGKQDFITACRHFSVGMSIKDVSLITDSIAVLARLQADNFLNEDKIIGLGSIDKCSE